MPVYKMQGKKDGLQKYRVRINKDGKQIDRVVYGKDEADMLERKLSMELLDKEMLTSITVGQLFADYKSTKKHEVRETSLEKDNGIIEAYILPTLKDIKLDKLTPQVLQNWKNKIEEVTYIKGKDENGEDIHVKLSLKSKQNIYSVFRAMLNYGVKMEFVSKNPLLKVGNFKDAYHSKPVMNYYTAEEFKLFISVAKELAETDNFAKDFYVFFNIAFFTGLRKGEIHALKWADIDGDYLTVSRSITQKLKGGDVETPPKNKSSNRTLQLPPQLVKILAEHKEYWQTANGFTDDFRVCGGLATLRDTTIENYNIKFSKAVGKKIRIHDFRHSHASLLANAGINIQEVARRLGHSKIEMTWNTYSHLYPKEEERAIAVLASV